MSWLKKIPKLSLILLGAIYGVFGWLYGDWAKEAIALLELRHQWLTPLVTEVIYYLAGLIAIVILLIYFTTPMTLLTLGMGNWFRADAKAIASIAVSIIVFALIIEYPAMLSRFLVLAAAAMLFRLDLHILGYPKAISNLILIGCSLLSFTGGVLLYNYERLASYWY